MQLDYYKPFFIYENDESVPEFIKRIMEHKFIDMRNDVIKLLNPHYEEWNEEYDSANKAFEDYFKFIADKQEAIFKEFNRKTGGPIFFHADPECDIIGRFKWRKKFVTMHLALKHI